MREIKFRAWDKENKEWYAPTHEAFKGNLWELLVSFSGDLCAHRIGSLEHESNWPDRYVLMQYTGLKDRHGRDIYFDDIVRFRFSHPDDPNEDWSGTAVITETMNGGAGLLFDWNESRSAVHAVTEGGEIEEVWPDDSLWRIEVIGNVWESPELINRKDND